MKNSIRLPELKVLAYRILLVYIFYQIARILFWSYNQNLLAIDSLSDLMRLCYYGIAFDTTAILYTNSVFILLSILPLVINTRRGFQKFLMWWYFIVNGIAYSLNHRRCSLERLSSLLLARQQTNRRWHNHRNRY